MSNLVSVPKNGSLTNSNSNQNFPSLSNWFDDIFNRDLPSVINSNFNTGITLPKVNIKETADAFVVEMAVPGLKKSDFQIEIDNQVLAISSETKEETKLKEEKYTRREFGYSSFKRTFTLPESVNDEKINASYSEGILSIILPKKDEAKQKPVRNIKIS
ncbi:Hsp20/alpha crystallin family protein [Oceanihabitans sediminis]|uniref:Hsp20/alpha crystallin family protein n=1 Tax=Oceanihabitans sediminis TaxID=1812012 RepID=A0A368P1F2_9FLAO|nr:Hsp20/alpha crystallin family protein [Oceanihabitans sediminis]MDX1279006.1 Hsp20/alpha crystallin family protein [Oceanihabitans sediminis]MDX1774629.1 Hsp20/alpha crystallin family protein [Oceanihabitans sediminis]RBP28490.1 HSP20 family protein [Oceanihabitans sediminis]RCU56687.1 Hsp20/alpha crystallin family protein [Oceanihabitans sediminis]